MITLTDFEDPEGVLWVVVDEGGDKYTSFVLLPSWEKRGLVGWDSILDSMEEMFDENNKGS